MEKDNKTVVSIGRSDEVPSQTSPIIPKPAPKSVEADPEKLIFGGIIEREVEPVKGLKVTMHTLLPKEKLKVVKDIPIEMLGHAPTTHEVAKVPTLVQAITKVDSEEFVSDAQKAKLLGILTKTPSIMVDLIYLHYMRMNDDILSLMETGEKKS